jgi:predicted SnoaL-like aldol condensation-catalyzing enzyme
MSETNKIAVVAFYKQALMEGDVENASQLYAGPTYRQHNPLIEDGMDGVRKFVTWIVANHPDARGEIKRVFADGDHVILHSHWHGLSDNAVGDDIEAASFTSARCERACRPIFSILGASASAGPESPA